MTTPLVVMLLGLAGIALVTWLVRREPDKRVRNLTAGASLGGYLVAMLIALAANTSMLAAVATGLFSGAVLSLASLLQWRLFRSLFARQGRKL